jgi:hypothetical protein
MGDANFNDLDKGGGYYEEEYHCSKCGKIFYMKYQDIGGIGYDPGYDKCPICYKHLCDECAQWHSYGDRYKKICKTCFNEEILYDFTDWYDIFNDEYCDRQCDDCPFFFKKGCMMILLYELVGMAFHTEEVKKVELERLQKRNRKAEKMWREELKNVGIQIKPK